MNAKREVNIPFPGFYESVLSMLLEDAEEQFIDYLLGENDAGDGVDGFKGRDRGDVQDAFYFVADYRVAEMRIAKEYAEAFAYFLDEAAGWPMRLKWAAMDSPREYNFTTDRLFMRIPRATVRRMFKETRADALFTVARERHTSRDGFASFYSPDWHTWGPLDKWDHNQIGTLLRAWMSTRDDFDDLQEDIIERIREDFDGALDAAVNVDELRARLEAKNA